jgi:hypothetical protein
MNAETSTCGFRRAIPSSLAGRVLLGLGAILLLPFDLDMKLENLDLAQFKTKASDTAPLAGELVGRIRLHGAGASVHKAAANAN